MDEHFELLELSGEVRRHLAVEDRTAARSVLVDLESLLATHVDREERGLFAAMKAQGDFVEAVVELEAEHVAFDVGLGRLDPDGPEFAEQVVEMLDDLVLHIDKENLGVFPAAVVTLGASGWDLVTQVHARQHEHGHDHHCDDDLVGAS